MRSASTADRSAICVTFSLPHENAVELQNMARSGAYRLQELGVLAVQVGNTTAISLQPGAGNSYVSVAHTSTHDRRQQTLTATRTNIARYLGADISGFPPAVGNGSAAISDIQHRSVSHQYVTSIASMSTSVTKGQTVNVVAQSSPHIVNLLQQDILSCSIPLLSSVPMSFASDVRPRKRARRRTPSAAAEVSVPLSMSGTADCVNSVYSFQHPSGCIDSSANVPSVHYMPAEQFKIPESRRRRACSSRKTSSSKSQQLISTGQAPSSNLTCNSFNAGFNENSKSSEVGMFNASSSYSIGDGFQMNGINPYHRIPVMTTGWQTYATRPLSSDSIYQSLPSVAQYPQEYSHPRFHFAGNVSYPQAANISRMPGIGSHRNVSPASSVLFVSDTNRMHSKEQVTSGLSSQTLRWSSATESIAASVPCGSNSTVVPSMHGVYNMTHDNSGSQPMSHIMQQQFVACRSDALPASASSKPCTETVTSVNDKMVHLSVSSGIDRLKNVPVCDTPNVNSLSVGSVNYQHVNGLFSDVHSSALAFHGHGHTAHIKMNGDIDCLQHADSQTPSKCAIFEKSTVVTVSPYALSAPTCNVDTNCAPERRLQQPSVQLPSKVQQCGLASLEDTGLNGCSASTTSDMPQTSGSSGMVVHDELKY